MTAAPIEDARHRMARTLLTSGYSVDQASERSGLPRRRVQELADRVPTPGELLVELRAGAARMPGRASDVIAETFAASVPPDVLRAMLVRAVTIVLDVTGVVPPVERPKPIPAYRPPQPSRKTEIVKDLVQARLETRVVVDGHPLRFGECTRDQVEQLRGKTRDAATALLEHWAWLGNVSEAMLTHRAATVGELPTEPRAALMEAKPE